MKVTYEQRYNGPRGPRHGLIVAGRTRRFGDVFTAEMLPDDHKFVVNGWLVPVEGIPSPVPEGGEDEPTTTTAPVAAAVPPTVPDSLSAMRWADLRKLAKASGVKAWKRGRADIEADLRAMGVTG